MSDTTTMMQATWNGTVLARSDDTVVVEGNHYFPRESLRSDLVEESDRRSTCPWKGEAAYLTVVVDGERNAASVWYYPAPKPAAANITDRVAFGNGIAVTSA